MQRPDWSDPKKLIINTISNLFVIYKYCYCCIVPVTIRIEFAQVICNFKHTLEITYVENVNKTVLTE